MNAFIRSLVMIIRTSIIILGLAYCFDAAEGSDMQVANSTSIVIGTNVTCNLVIEHSSNPDIGPSPLCLVKLSNLTDIKLWGLRPPPEMLLAIDLVDADGQSVEKTDYGKKFGQSLTQKQLNDWVIPIRLIGHISAGFFFVPLGPNSPHSTKVADFSIPKAFDLKKDGYYTLHVRMRLIQSCFS